MDTWEFYGVDLATRLGLAALDFIIRPRRLAMSIECNLMAAILAVGKCYHQDVPKSKKMDVIMEKEKLDRPFGSLPTIIEE